MARPAVTVRRLDENSIGEFIALWSAAKVEDGMSAEAAARHANDGSIQAAVARPEVTVLLAEVDSRTAGFIVLADGSRNVLSDGGAVAIEMVHVAAAHRKSGVGKAMLAAAARVADRAGCPEIIASVPVQDRDLNRYFARLGFAPETTRRVVTSAALQRRLSGEREAPKYSLDAVLTRRREARARALKDAAAKITPPTAPAVHPSH